MWYYLDQASGPHSETHAPPQQTHRFSCRDSTFVFSTTTYPLAESRSPPRSHTRVYHRGRDSEKLAVGSARGPCHLCACHLLPVSRRLLESAHQISVAQSACEVAHALKRAEPRMSSSTRCVAAHTSAKKSTTRSARWRSSAARGCGGACQCAAVRNIKDGTPCVDLDSDN